MPVYNFKLDDDLRRPFQPEHGAPGQPWTRCDALDPHQPHEWFTYTGIPVGKLQWRWTCDGRDVTCVQAPTDTSNTRHTLKP